MGPGLPAPLSLHYHIGHTWLRPLEPALVTVGLDDFSAHLIGPPDRLELPPPGTRLRQGALAFRAIVDGRCAELLSPVDGDVVGVNPRLEAQPALVSGDPFGRGWLCAVVPTDIDADLRNLLSGTLARRWLEECHHQLARLMMSFTGTVIGRADTGTTGLARRLPEEDWEVLVRSFFLS